MRIDVELSYEIVIKEYRDDSFGANVYVAGKVVGFFRDIGDDERLFCMGDTTADTSAKRYTGVDGRFTSERSKYKLVSVGVDEVEANPIVTRYIIT